MSHTEDFLFKKPQINQITSDSNNFLPAGSMSSFYELIQADEELIINSNLQDFLIEDEAHISYQIIAYESMITNTNNHKETQTESNDIIEKNKIQEMNKTIIKLTLECNAYVKQNEDLRKEIITTNYQKENDKIESLQEEVKRLKSKLHVHENMIDKVINMAEEICEGQNENIRKNTKIDFHSYNYLMSKLEILKSRLMKYNSKIKQLEADKMSITEMLNFYVSAGNLIKTQKISKGFSCSVTPDCINPAFSSRKSSVLMENSANSLRKTPFEDEDYSKKPSSSGSDMLEHKELINFPNTLINLKGISRLTTNNTIKKAKNDISHSISPIIPKPRKKSKKNASSKENLRSTTIRNSKGCIEDMKKPKRLRYKS